MTYTRSFRDTYVFANSTNGGAAVLTQKVVNGSRTGTALLGWRQKVRDGSDATTPYTSDRSRIIDTRTGAVTLQLVRRPANPDIFHSFNGSAVMPPESVGHLNPGQPAAEADALRSAYRKINAQLSHWSGASSLAEFGDVLRQFGHPFKAILDLSNRRINKLELAARGLKGSTVFKKKSWKDIVADTYLEYAFGLAPLISDTKKAAEAFARFNLENSDEFRLVNPKTKIVARGKTETTSISNTQGVIPGTYIVRDTTQKWSTEHRVQYVVGLGASTIAAYGSNERLIQLLGFRPQDWIPAAWEVVPWSWLVDYFTNVGDILNAAATTTSDVKWISKTVTDVTEYETMSVVNVQATTDYAHAFVSGVPVKIPKAEVGYSKFVRTSVVRTSVPTLGVPPLVFTLPDKVGQLANLAAVFLGRRQSSSALWLT